MARKKGDVMFETTPFLTFYHILTGDPSVSGFAHTIGITLGKDGSLSMVNANACINVNQPRAGVVTTWLEPEVIDREFKEVEPAAPVQELDLPAVEAHEKEDGAVTQPADEIDGIPF
jgi:hypothetical protein